MARLTALPSLDIIHGFQGVLDFYLWKGLPCVRSWPRITKAQQTEGTIAAAAIFGEISAAYRLLAPLELTALQEQAKDQPRTARDLYISAAYGHLHEEAPAAPAPPEEQMYDAYVCLRDLKSIGTQGGGFNAGAWSTRDLTQEQADPQDICALEANQFFLAPGTYRCMISCPGVRIGSHAARLYNVTGDALLLQGTIERQDSADSSGARTVIAGRFTVAADQTLEIQHRGQLDYASAGFGWGSTFQDEIFTIAEFWREIEEE
ncbi:hypothetical protein ES708_27303 [subsurface metagenome]